MREDLNLNLNFKKKEEDGIEKQTSVITEFNRDKDHEKDHYYDVLGTFFSNIVYTFLSSSLTFPLIIKTYHKAIDRDIPKDLKEILIREDIRILIDDSFGGGYCPDRSPFEKIPVELRKRIFSEYFDETYLGYFDVKFFWRIILEAHVIPFLKDFKKDNYNYEKIMNEILIIVPENMRKAIIDEYYVKNWASILKINENEKIPSNQEIEAIKKNIVC